MQFFFGWSGENSKLAVLREAGASRLLISYAILRDHADGRWPDRANLARFADMDVLIDSGAFSAFKSGKPISIEEYQAFLDRTHPAQYMNLDVIGDWRATLENQHYLEARGYHPIPVWHPQDPWALLGEMTATYPLIALGGLVPLTPTDRWATLRRVFGEHPHTYHGLGIGSPRTLRAFPWYSCDSASWDVNSIYWKVQGFEDKWTPRREHIQRLMAVERTWQPPPVQDAWAI